MAEVPRTLALPSPFTEMVSTLNVLNGRLPVNAVNRDARTSAPPPATP
ncbi:MAG: hypothetical protein M3R48_01380 [Candidatus Dormibacteraeota bacterium]|nr:hypothetical protein [Candidatus Dormibacteraeota bacterium]